MLSRHKRAPYNASAFLGIIVCGIAAVNATALEIVVGPYLQYPTQTSIVIRWETDKPASSEAAYGPSADELAWLRTDGDSTYHEIKVESLEPSACYFYQVRSASAAGDTVESELLTFQTTVLPDEPFSFVVLCDTQSNPQVVSTLAAMAWDQRPHFTLHGGDLVRDGRLKGAWTRHFFPSMHVLNSRVALIPCLGNHDEDSQNYYDYFSLPAPEYYYRFCYGNCEIFIVDSQRSLAPGSEQYSWLDGTLSSSAATWKIVCFHKPPYSSDENDYGDTTRERSAGGDPQIRLPIELYEKHGVDIVWSGHIHSYERTHPLLQGRPVADGGVLYMITGGGGGGLEKAAPWRMPFSAKVFSGHHYCLVSVLGEILRIEAFDLEGKIFDFVELRK